MAILQTTGTRQAPNPDAAAQDARAQHMLGAAEAERGHFAEAIAAFSRAVAINPEQAASWSNLGMMLKIERRFEEAVAAHDKAVALGPDVPQLRVNRAVALLHAGRMAEAWRDYEFRLRQPGHTTLPLEMLLPTLASGVAFAGRRVLVTHEEGFGDTLHFIRYAPMLAALGARVLVLVPPALTPLLRGLAGVDGVLTEGAPTPSFDFHCPVFSLPRVFATTLETIPAPVSYLAADPALVAHWSTRLPIASRGKLRVGIVWAGQSRPWLAGFTMLDRRRSTSLATLAPFANLANATLISLQVGPPAEEARSPPPGLVMHDPMSEVRDFADTAAIIAGLDLVVSVDTSVVHLAGALGKPVFLLDRYDNCWRWFSGREDSPWYPMLRIFRQDRPGDWSGPVARAAETIAALCRLA